MTPHYCQFHQQWTDGPCGALSKPLSRHDLLLRLGDIDAMLGDDESAQSRGYHANQALEVEKVQLQALRDVLP